MFSNLALFKYHKVALPCVLLSLIFYTSFAYDLDRTNAIKLVTLYSFLFVLAYVLKKSAGFNFKFLVIASLLFRIVFLVAIPNLSQDFYRFIWDGRMLLEGFNPYLYTPDFFIQNGKIPFPQGEELYNGMGALNASHYTNYPPINQLCFVIANLFGAQSTLGSVIVMRLIIILADMGILFFGKKLLENLKLPSSRIWWYMLNPFIIIELTGNLHFEGVMLFFLLWSLYLLHKGKWQWSAVVFACSISVKLIPLMFLPLFFWWFFKRDSSVLRINKLASFYLIVLGITFLFFLPFFSKDFITNYSETVGLWFTNFEFNASIYYLARKIGYAITGYNEIAIIGKFIPILSIAIILGFSFFRKNTTTPKLITSILLAFSFYLFLSTTVHPWYIATLVSLCLFTNYRYPLVWSLIIVLSYLSYLGIGSAAKSENLWIISIEYSVVFAAFIWEVIIKRDIKI